jgi:putative thioredoxin
MSDLKIYDWITEVGLETFEDKVLSVSEDVPVLIDLWAEWCSPCLVIAPVLKQVIEEYAGQVRLAKIEVDDGENMKLAGRYQVRGFPTVILIEHGEEVARFSGAKPYSYIRDFIDQNTSFSID